MEASRSGGPWSRPGPAPYSQDTQDMLRLMVQESRLTTLQKRRIADCLQRGAALPLTFDPPRPAPPREPRADRRWPSTRPLRRGAEACRSGDGYVRERFCPGPTRDLEKEKSRLQNIMSTGREEPAAVASDRGHDPEDKDRFEEVLGEIEERRQFLADMVSLGQGKKYANIINAEISQKIRELEMLDKESGSKGRGGDGRGEEGRQERRGAHERQRHSS